MGADKFCAKLGLTFDLSTGGRASITCRPACEGGDGGLPCAVFRSVGKGWVPVTLYELAIEYNQTVAQVLARIRELEQMKKAETVQWRINALDGRIRSLQSLYRDTRRIAKHLENYYRKWMPRQDKSPQLRQKTLSPMDHRRRP